MVMSNLTTIHERTGSLSGRRESNPDNPVVPGVKVLGIDSKNGRKYPVEVMKKALEKYEGAIVNIDHPAGSEPRSYEDRFGRLANARLESDGIYADLSYNPKHPLAEGFKWWVANDPKAIGLSHNAQAKTKLNAEGVEEIEEIVTVESVDLVAEPATTAGLLEAVMKKTVEDKSMNVKEARPDQFYRYLNQALNQYWKSIEAVESELVKVSKTSPHVEGPAKQAASKFQREAYAAGDSLKNLINDIGNGKFNESVSRKGSDSMNVKEESTEMKVRTGIRLLDEKAKALESAAKPNSWIDGFLKHTDSRVASELKKINDQISKAAAQLNSLVGNLKGGKYDFFEGKVTKKLNAMEAKKRKSIKRILVAEAIKDILKVRKGV